MPLTKSQADELAGIPCFEVMPGWDTLNGYVIVKGTVPYGFRVDGSRAARGHAERHLEIAQAAAPGWAVVDIGPAEPAEEDDAWNAVHTVGTASGGGALGLGAPLVAIVESLHPEGEWRIGRHDASPYRVGKNEKVVVRVVGADVVAIVAPIVREDSSSWLAK